MKTLLLPLILILQTIYMAIAGVVGSYGVSLLLLSLITSLIMAWLGSLIKRYPEREALVQSLMASKLERIKQEPNPEQRHLQTVEIYKRYRYHPILALRTAFPLFLQLPFLFAAYHMLSNMPELQGVSFLMIKDLSASESLFLSYNLLPLFMTFINILTAFITPNFGNKDRIQAIVIAVIFLVLLYRAASALLIYWTANNIIFLVRSVYMRFQYRKVHAKVKQDYKALIRKSLPVVQIYFALLSIFYLYQALALEDGYLFPRLYKYIPFLMVGFALWLLQIINLTKLNKAVARYTGLAAVLAIIVVLALNVSDYSMLPELFSILAYAFIISSFILGILIHLYTPRSYTSRSVNDGMSSFSCLAVVIVLALIPATHFARSNRVYLLGIYPYIYFVGIALMAILNYYLIRILSGTNANRFKLVIYSGVFNLLFIALPLIRSFFRSTSVADIDFWIILALGMALISFVHTKQSFMNLLRISILILAVFIISFLFFSPHIGSSFPRVQVPQDLAKLEFAERPNIYLFVYDGIPNQRVFKDLDLPLDKLEKILSKYGFKLYEDTYTLMGQSLASMSRTLNFSTGPIGNPEARDIYAGNSLANVLLRDKGYQSRFILANEYTGYAEITHDGLFEELYPPRSAQESQWDYYLTLMRGILQGEMRFDTKGLDNWDETIMQARKLEIIREQKPPTFVVNHYHYPGHSQNSGKCLPNESELWIQRFEIALKQMNKDFQAIAESDPDAIVIAIGDHGPYLTGDCFDLGAWSKEEVTPDLIWDRIGTMIAIRWPIPEKAEKYDSLIVTNQDIFPVLFAYLSNSEIPLSYCPEDLYQGLLNPFRFKIGFERGKIIR